MVKRFYVYQSLLAFVLLCAGCAPRGETKSLKEVLQIARQNYSSTHAVVSDTAVADALHQVTDEMEKMVAVEGQTVAAPSCAKVAQLLRELVPRAGYTTRPALGEIVSQFQVMGTKSNLSSGQVMLLVSRTYTLLASELGTTKFSL